MIGYRGGNAGIGGYPSAKLDVEGGAFLGYETTISDFGAPLKAGFYQDGGATVAGDVPDQSSPWSHLIVSLHNATTKNYQLQIASTYTSNDRLFFRKIANGSAISTNPAWNEIATRGSNTFTGNEYFMSGNVGIGTATPSSKLDVNGEVKAETITFFKDGVQYVPVYADSEFGRRCLRSLGLRYRSGYL